MEIMKGIFNEGDKYKSIIQVLPSSTVTDSANRVFNELVNFSSQVVIWLTPNSKDCKTIEYLRSNNIPVIIARRWRLINGGCCVQPDFNSAGFETGEKFIESGCKKALIFDDHNESSGENIRQPDDITLNIREGIAHSFSNQGEYAPEKIRMKKFDSRNPRAGTDVLRELGNTDDETGVIFCNGDGFLNLLDTGGDKIRRALHGKELTVLGNSLINHLLIPRAKELNFRILDEHLEAVGRSAVQKALSVYKGYLDDTTTLVKIKLKSVRR